MFAVSRGFDELPYTLRYLKVGNSNYLNLEGTLKYKVPDTGKTPLPQRCAYKQASKAQVPARSSKR